MKLKTLKDLNIGEHTPEFTRNQIKAEAIKWVKEDFKFLKFCMAPYDVEIIIRMWMLRHNITEEDIFNDTIKRMGKSHAESGDRIIEAVSGEDLK